MQVTMLGTSNPCPNPDRAGTSIFLEIAGDPVLIDCGPWATYRLVEYDINFATINDVFFTHHHMDHNAAFFHFVTMSWYFGRQELTVYGPTGTQDLVDGFHTAYQRHIEDVAKWRNQEPSGMTDIGVVNVTPEFELSTDGWTVEAIPTDHAYTMEVYAYRFVEHSTDETFVFSGDTTPMDTMIELADNADLLVHECNITGQSEKPLGRREAHERYFQEPFSEYFDWVFGKSTQEELTEQLHSSPAEAGRIAEAAGVDTLVLTHLNPLRNSVDIEREAADEFSGTVIVAEDGMRLSP
jgi:ribonuclease BN (tRNA processing enzyme)